VAERRLSKKQLKDGERLDVDLFLSFHGFFPFLFVTVVDPLPPALGGLTEGNQIWKLLLFRRNIRFSYVLAPVPRGEHSFTEVWMEWSDLFGFFHRRIILPLPDQILVFPSYEEVRSFPTINEKNAGLTFALRRSSEDVALVMGIRDYIAGDRLNRIHWKATARTGSLKTKEFEVHVTNDFLLFPDCTQKGYAGKSDDFERSIRLAATLIRYSVKHGYHVGLSLYQKERIFVPLGRNSDHEIRLFTQLARAKAVSLYPFPRQLVDQMAYIPYGTTVVIITPQWDQEMMRALSIMRMRKLSLEFFLVAPRMPEGAPAFFIKEGISYHLLDKRPIEVILKGGVGDGERAIPY
ncbi:MAG: DUF58 domain-containing protein, partial [Thermicanus sp.]|nr:DUF58 domain-containing protein [Thermicanus sp.]